MAPANREIAEARNEVLPAKPQEPVAAQAAQAEKVPGVRIAVNSVERKALSAADRESQLVFGRNLKDVPIGQVVEALDQQGEQVAVVKLTVVDRQQGLRDLQVLLKRHQIVSADAAPANENAAKDGARSKNPSLLAVYVETSDNQLAAAMRELQKEAAFRQLTIDAPIAVAQLDPLMTSPRRLERQRRNGLQPFSAAGAGVPGLQSLKPQIKMKAARTPSAAPAAAAPAENSANAAAPKPAPSKTKAPAQSAQARPAVGEKKPAARFGAMRSARVSNGQSEKPAAQKRDEIKRAAKRDEFGSGGKFKQRAGSQQRQLTLPVNVLDSLQKKIAGADAKKVEAAGTNTSPDKRVQILFVLVDDPAKPDSQPAPPAKKPAPPAADNNGAA